MAKFVCEFEDKPDVVCDSYDQAWQQKNVKYISCAPDKDKKWWNALRAPIPHNSSIWVLYEGNPVRGFCFYGIGGIYVNLLGLEKHKTLFESKDINWLPIDWFRLFEPDSEDMRQWQLRDEYEDRE